MEGIEDRHLHFSLEEEVFKEVIISLILWIKCRLVQEEDILGLINIIEENKDEKKNRNLIEDRTKTRIFIRQRFKC